MTPLPKKKVPPPPKEPGTHTNPEVKEALHARAMRRTVIITAVVFLLFAALAVISSTAQDHEGIEDTTSLPKMVIMVVNDLDNSLVERARHSNKLPFWRAMSRLGGVSGELCANYSDLPTSSEVTSATHNLLSKARLVKLLTGVRDNQGKHSLQGETSFLGKIKQANLKPVIIAPDSYFSKPVTHKTDTTNNNNDINVMCAQIGLFDTECSGTACPTQTAEAYCNAFHKHTSCANPVGEVANNQIVNAFGHVLEKKADILYVQVNAFESDSNEHNNNNNLDDNNECKKGSDCAMLSNAAKLSMKQSLINLIDASFGQIALALVERTRQVKENWLLVMVGDGNNEKAQAPLYMAAYSRGELVQLQNMSPEPHYTTELYSTILKWFGIAVSDSDDNKTDKHVIGICSDGIHVSNCQAKNVSDMQEF